MAFLLFGLTFVYTFLVMSKAARKNQKNVVSKNYLKEALSLHKKLRGKLEIFSKIRVKNRQDLSLVYTPGVGAVADYCAKNPQKADLYTGRRNLVAVVSDGTAVLGLGNLGPIGAYPVMEGKAVLFKELADINAVPLVVSAKDDATLIEAIVSLEPTFGGINLEDIAAPRCFMIEAELKKRLSIPVMHDDQHGTAVVVLAGLINALKVARKDFKQVKIVVSGAGAAGTAITELLLRFSPKDIFVLDRSGIIGKRRKDLVGHKKNLAERTNFSNRAGGLSEALIDADVFVGVSSAGLLNKNLISTMADRSIVFALANPVPEIMPEEAKIGGALVVATGRSDFPNQVNNALAFPGIFRGALDNRVLSITEKMKEQAAKALASLIQNPKPEKILPEIFDRRIVPNIAKVIR